MKIIYLISLLSWTTSPGLLINLMTLKTFWQFHENLTWFVCAFFIPCTLKDLADRWYYHKQKFLMFFLAPCRPHLLLRSFPLTVRDRLTNTFCTEIFGWPHLTLRYQTLLKKVPGNRHKTGKQFRFVKI